MILITGAAKKLGREIALALSKDYPVVIHYKTSETEAKEVQKMTNGEIIYGDFSTQKGIEDFTHRYLSSFPKTKVLINNASTYFFGSFLTSSPTEAMPLWNCNFFAPYHLCHALAPSIIAEQGSIINLGIAGVAYTLSDQRTSFYTLSKLSLWMLTKSLAKELAPHHVCVNMISPGYLEQSVDLPTNVPMKRYATHQEIVQAIRFLLDNTYITGQNLEVAGGVRL